MANETILIVEDEKLVRWSLKERLKKDQYDVFEAENGAGGIEILGRETIDLIVLDYRLPDMTGLDVLRKTVAAHPEIPVILMTAYSSVDTAVEAIKLGAYDYINKPFNHDEMVVTVARALESSRLRREVRHLRSEQERRYGLTNIVGKSRAIIEVLELIEKIAKSQATTVLIQGESGTGKDLVAKAIHYASDRAGQPFMNITCSALPETLLESELMGHERGSFTDARFQKKGLFELADGGTLFLDEIGDMGVLLQAKLLRFLQEKTFKRVGGVKDITVKLRIIAATNRDLEEAVRNRSFREDLYYRLKVIPITLPPLRDRKEDIPALVRHFIDGFNQEFKKTTKGVNEEALQCLMGHTWPGNVRELKNVIERAMILENKAELSLGDLPKEIREPAAGADLAAGDGFSLPESGYSLERMEGEMVKQALEKTRGNQTHAARLLSISRDALRYKMKKFGYL
ncbi:MAG: sigma-54-dependent Fis family transcriptional regulator [Acidobacteria bacterium]|nr:sigma-54-dependent Fis family transcriptional regulator [Acidobacteriota bacterium]